MGAALLHELSVASHTVNDFGQDERREQAHITHGAQVTLDERLRPLYLKRYGLDPSQYTDSHGHFSLTGAD